MVNKSAYSDLELMQARIIMIPRGWVFSYVGKVFSIKNNLRRPISEEIRAKNVGKYPYFGPTKIQGYIDTYEQDGHYVLIGEDGDHFLKYKSQSMTQLVDGKCTVNNHAHIIEGTNEAIREWFYYYFMHRDIFSFLSRQGAGRYKLNKASLEKIPLIVPPLGEQKKIAEIISTWDKAIAITEKLLANSQLQKKALMQQLLTGEKRLAGFKQAWSKVKVSKMGSISSGGTPDTTKKEYWDGGINWLTPTDVTSLKSRYVFSTNKTISEKGLKSSSAKMLPRGALLICTRATIGAMAISTTEIATNQGFKNLVPNAEFSVEFLYYLFTFNVKELVRKSSGSTFLELSKSDFEKLTFLCPCLDEQHKIASVLIAADDAIAVQQQKLHYLKQEKKALMQQLLTGKRRVKVEAA
ncbi:restriction endonuclease subunit S [Klebsiella oxytoca]|uniref:restriction endonuclease subunit S n=1 Tax=Klebsiella TaxID=570 RepID=UPI0018C6BC80|nr:restriction endonuclease subunit S [Klebsiella oxytoca]MBG2705027.1 restriction endonuclease subunit S [Klebsiella oxytoca]HEJ7344398.1 restriction endonuclease subunit S [Klebsiella oxytoca]